MDAASNIADQTYSRAKSIAMQFAIFIFMLLSLSAECLCDNTRKSIAIADLNFTGIEISQKESFIDALTTKLHSSSVYAVIERSQINQILREQAFQQSGVCDQPKCAIELGKLLGANKLIFGSVGLISNQAFANLRIVDVETGSIDKSYSNLRKGDFSELMSEIASDAAGELTGLASKSDVIGTNLVDIRDGKIYHTFKFQKKVWMAENLNYSSIDSRCYNNDEKQCDQYGRLYRHTAIDTICPQGWHVSSDDDWLEIEKEIGVPNSALMRNGGFMQALFGRGRVAGKLRRKTGWADIAPGIISAEDVPDIDAIGFCALPSGAAIDSTKFDKPGIEALFWSPSPKSNRLFRGLVANFPSIIRDEFGESGYLSCRCVKNQ